MAAPRLTTDPNIESCPDFTSAPYKTLRELIVAGSAQGTALTDAEAGTQLVDGWTADRDARKLLWDAQIEADTAQAAVDAAALAAQSELDRAAAEAAAEAERFEADKKKPKLGNFDTTLSIPDFLGPRPSNFAKKKLDDMEYVELWYWTKEGCIDAELSRAGVEADESFGLTQIGSTISLKSASYKASKKVIRDEDLSFTQLSVAKTGFLASIATAGWPAEHRAALASFFYAIESHPSRAEHDDYAESILVIYQAKSRRYWHDTLVQDRGFNIAIFNDKLLEQIAKEYYNKLRSSQHRLVRSFPF
ncbi:hypothetical protein C8R47DRAFT_997701 [Mycena vitilis]|nr:hypothetical protein C8R47DRAFT_997701 [Mycena vitilis]